MDTRFDDPLTHHRGRSQFRLRKRDTSADRALKVNRDLSRFMNTADYKALKK